MRHWYTNVYVILMMIVSAIAVCMAGLMFLLLPQSGEVIRLMQWRMVRADSFRYDVLADYDGQSLTHNEEGASIRDHAVFVIEDSGQLDRFDPEQFKMSNEFAIRVGAVEPTLDFAGEHRRVMARDFVRFADLPKQMGPVKLEPFKDKWLAFDIDSLRKNIDLPFFGAADKPMDEVDQATLLEELRRTPFFVFEGRIGTEKIGGISTLHYKVKPEVLYIKDYVIRAEQLRLHRDLTNRERNAVDKFFSNLVADDGELWIGSRDYYLYRALLKFHYRDSVDDGDFTVTVKFSDFNKPAQLAVPEGEKLDVDEIVLSLLPGIVQHLPLANVGAVRRVGEAGSKGLPIDLKQMAGDDDPDKDGLSNVLEYFYGCDPNNPDTDGDGIKDGEAIAKGLNCAGGGPLFDFGITSRGKQ